jgi:CHASE3 domain sensor protein
MENFGEGLGKPHTKCGQTLFTAASMCWRLVLKPVESARCVLRLCEEVTQIKMIRKMTLQIGFPVLLAFIAWNAYSTVNQFKRVRRISTMTLISSANQADLSSILKELTDMETAQRGYLLTDDLTYLQPFTDAKERIGTDFARLRAGLANRTQNEQSLETQLESLAKSKQAEMERSIDLRQRGFRLRSFKLVGTNEGKEYMDEIRRIASSLSATESGDFAKLEREGVVAFNTALRVTIVSNSALLVLTGCLFGLMRHHARLQEKEAAQSRQELAVRESQLERLMSALSGEARSNIDSINTLSELLLEKYGDFLPRQGQEYAEQMKEAALRIERLRQDLVGSPESAGDERAA